MKTSRFVLGTASLAFLIGIYPPANLHAQGSLTPPGPPGPTMKTLSQIEPRTPISSLPYSITIPGSYYLTTNLTGVSGSDGIDIMASDVTLDLKGFTLPRRTRFRRRDKCAHFGKQSGHSQWGVEFLGGQRC